MHKKSIAFILTILMLVLTSFSGPAALAQTGPTETPVPTEVVPPAAPLTVGDPEDVVLFSQLNQTETLLRGPYDAMRVRFSTPAFWQLEEGAVLQLHLRAAYYVGTGTALTPTQANGATIDVTFNNQYITTIVLDWSGDRIVEIPIPAEALVSPRSDGRHGLELFLDAAKDCNYLDHVTTVAVRDSSAFILPHSIIPLPTDLTILPRPIFQPDAFLPGSAAIVVADAPSAGELQAAMTVAAGFGRLTANRLPISLVTISQLGPAVTDNNHIILVGTGNSIAPLLSAVTLPAIEGAQPEDGIVQITGSPWSDAHMLLMVTGDTDAAVVKAAEAVTSGALRTAGRPDLALVANVEESIEVSNVAPDRTFGDLGYEAQSLTGIGMVNAVYEFSIPYGQVPTGTASLDLVFNSSAMLDYGLSGMVVYLNDLVIGSVRFGDATAQTTSVNISLPVYALRPGSNRLNMEVNLMPSYYCADLRLNNLWVNISPESTLHIPLSEAATTTSALVDLSYYPFPFVSNPTLGGMSFVLAQGDPQGWNIAAAIASDLGHSSFGKLVELSTAYGDAVPDDLRQNHDLLVVGKASQIPLVAELNDALPAPYPEGSDMASESGPGVVYRLPEGTSVGYLQLVTSPWNPARSVLAVLGSTDQGLTWAGNALTVAALQGRLTGNYAVISDQQVVTTDTRLASGTGNLAATAIPPSQPQPEASPAAVVTPPAAPVQQNWILPVLIGSAVLMLAVVGVAIFGSLRSGRQ